MSLPRPKHSNSRDEKSTASLAKSASLLAFGNIASRIFGLLREIIIAFYFGASGQVSASRVATQVPMLVYDFLIGGMLSAALVPTLSAYTGLDKKAEFGRVVGVLLSVFALLLAVVVLILEIATPWITWLMAAGFRETQPELIPVTIQLIHLTVPLVWLMGMAGVIMATLYACQRFTYPSLATAIYNLGIVVTTPLLASRFGIQSLVIGLFTGSVAQVLLMLWDLHRVLLLNSIPLRFSLAWTHPALRNILRLYLPTAIGFIVTAFQVILDRRLASGTGEQSIAWMQNATTLQQLPLGLTSVAIALAALPTLSIHFTNQDEDAFRETLWSGLRIVLILILPAALILWMLGDTITQVIFEHGQFSSQDTRYVVQALNIYVVGMLFAAIDFPLNYAFYARNNTILPAFVGVLSVGVYIIVADSLLATLGFLGLVWADSAKQASHAVVMMGLLTWRIGGMRINGGRLVSGLFIAIIFMCGTVHLILQILSQYQLGQWIGMILELILAGGSGLIAYVMILQIFQFDEVTQLRQFMLQRLRHQ